MAAVAPSQARAAHAGHRAHSVHGHSQPGGAASPTGPAPECGLLDNTFARPTFTAKTVLGGVRLKCAPRSAVTQTSPNLGGRHATVGFEPLRPATV